MSRRVLVCGGRNYNDEEAMLKALGDKLRFDDVVVHGGARGADALAGDLAGRILGCEVEVHPADWHKYGRSAGPIRNQEMLDTGIDLVLAFSGGRGTADMVSRAERARVMVVQYG